MKKRPDLYTRREVCRGLLSGCAALALSGCGAAPSARPEADESEDPVLTLYMPGSSGSGACARISDKLSALTRAQYGFSVRLEQADPASYQDLLWLRLKNGGAPDVFFVPGSMPLSSLVYEDCVRPLSALLAQRPALRAAFSERQWNCREYYRILYAVPARETGCYRLAFLARTDILDGIGADPAAEGLDGLHELLARVHDAYPELTPVVPDGGATLPCLDYDPLNNGLGVLMGNQGTEVVNWYDSEEYAGLCARMYRWAQEGLVLREGCLRTEAAGELMQVCGGFGYFAKLGADRSAPDGLTAIPLSPMLCNSSGIADSWALPIRQGAGSHALELLELLYTGQEAARLFAFGEEGVDELPDAADAWVNDRVSMACLHPDAPLGLPRELRMSAAYGFTFNEPFCEPQISVCGTVCQRYHNALMCGYLNPEEALPLFRAQLREAGIDELVAAKQTQLNNWLNAVRG